jgi:putative addiction module component (TIGR02574 family)
MTEQLYAIISRMTVRERITLVQEILDTIVAEQMLPELTPELKQELDRRIADMEANPHDVVPWETVRANALAQCKE